MNTVLFTSKSHLRSRICELLPECPILSLPKQATDSSIILCDPESAVILLQHSPHLKTLVLSDTPSYAEGTKLLSLGIRGYANTYIHGEHLIQALESVQSGNVWLYPEFMQQMIKEVTSGARDHSTILNKLTEREAQAALLVCEGRSNKEIAVHLDITERTVKNHLTHIFEKLGVSDRLSLAMLLK